jgi:PGF-pre-PGF domain-containing protein
MFPKGTEKCKKIGFIFISIALSVLLLSVFASAYSNETVSIGSTVVNPGVSFSLPVLVDNITNIRSLSLDVLFNSSYLLIDDIDGNSSSSVSDTHFYLDNSTGFANMTLEFDNLSSEKELNVASLMFRSVTSGDYDIVLRNVSFSNDTISFPADYVVNGSVRVNYPPQIDNIENMTVDVGSNLNFSLNATDQDDTNLSFSVERIPAGYSLNSSNGSFSWTPTETDVGIHNVTFSVSDGYASNSTFAIINVTEADTEINYHPELQSIGHKSVDELTELSFTATANDTDALAFSLSGSVPTGASISAAGLFTWSPTEGQGPDSYIFDVVVSDGELIDNETISVTVLEVNEAPILDSIGSQNVDELSELNFTATATDSDLPVNNLTFSLSGSVPSGASITSDGIFTWTPTEEQGPDSYSFDVEVSDGSLSDNETIIVTVSEDNFAPVLDPIGSQSVDELTELNFTATSTDDEASTFSLSGSVPSGASVTSDGIFTWTPTESHGPGSYTFDVVASDGELSDNETITVTVNEVNEAPILASIVSQSVDEVTELSFTATATDADLPVNNLTFSLSGNVPSGASITSDGIFSWTPDYNDSDIYVVEFTVSDGKLTDSESVTIEVLNVNRAPVLSSPGSYSAAENSSVVITLSANDPDTGDSLNYSCNVTFGSMEDNIFTWTPDYDSSGIHAIEFTVSDGDLSDSGVAIITVSNTNRQPYIEPISDYLVINENEELVIEINGSDLDGDTLTYDKSVDFGSLDDNIFTWTPGFDDSGIYDVSFTVSDGNLSYTEGTKIAVGNTNVPPVLDHIGEKTVDENNHLSFTINATDEDSGDTLTYSASGLPSGASFSDQTRQFSWIPTYNQSGTYNVFFEVSDGTFSDSELVEIVVNNVNIAPVLAPIGNITVNENSEISLIVTATDHDKDSLVYSVSNPFQVGSFNSITHEFRWTPDYEDSGIYDITFTVSDNDLSDSETIYIEVQNVNRAPELDSIGNKAVNEAGELSFTINATDFDHDSLIYSVSGIPDGASFDTSTHTFTWAPDYDDSGTYDVTFNVSDGSLFDSETISISVGSVNRPPELNPVGDLFVDENELLTVSLQANDKDEGDALYYSVTDAPEGCIINSSTGAFTWTPSYEDAGIHNVLFSVSDGQTQDTENVKITVANINRPPQIDIPLQVYVAENSTLYLDLNASDPDNTPLETSTDFESGSLQDGIFTWNTGYEDEGNYDVTFTVSDGELEVSQTVEIIVTGSNSAPVLYSISSVLFLVNELDTVTINLTAVDIDGDELIFSKNVSYGNISGDVFTWTPGSDDSGIYYILFTVSDGQLSDSKTAIIAVGNTNRPPSIVHTGTQIVKENDPLEFILNATDPDNDTLSYTVSDLPNGALFDNSTGSFSWTPTYEQSDSYTVEFYASDMIYTAVDTVIINVENVNRAPLFETMPMCEVNETEQVCINLSASDPDDDSVSFSTEFDNGKIIGDTFVWDTGYYDSGEYNILFNATDGDLCDSTTVYVKVNPTNMPPEIESIGSHSVYENETLEFYVNATDADNDTLTYSVSGKPSGSFFDPETQLFRWTPDYRQSGTYSIEFHVTDGELNDSEAITIRVYNVDNTKATDYSGFSSSDSSGGGGGGASSGAEDYNNVAYKDYSIKYVTQGSQIEFKFPNSEDDLDTLSFTALKAAGHVKTVIEILHDRSSLVSTNPPGNVYRHINIWVGDTKFNSGNYFSSAEITFRVSKQWFEENNAEQSSVKLYRYSGGSWNQLKPSRIGTDANNYYFKAQTPGFSPFAIVSTGSSQAPGSSVPESTAQSTQVIYKSNSGLNSVSDVSTDAEIMTKALEQEPVSPFNTSIFFVGIVGILLIGSAIGYHSRNESPVLRRYYEAIHAFVLGMGNAAEWTAHKLSSESMHEDYAALGVKLNEIRNADYKAIYEKKLAEIKERQKQ